VDEVVITNHLPRDPDRSVCTALRAVRPHIFANGGDRKPDGDPVPEVTLCEELGIKMVYGVGKGGKIQSSSWLIADAAKHAARSKKSKLRSATQKRARKLRRNVSAVS